MSEPTEQIRRRRADLAASTAQTWTTEQLLAEFKVLGFLAPFVAVRRKSDGMVGSLQFTHSPRVYFGWQPDAAPREG